MAGSYGGDVIGEAVAGDLRWNPHYDQPESVYEQVAADKSNLRARIPIRVTEDIVKARRVACMLAEKMGISASQTTLVTLAISELARNIILYAKSGEIVLSGRNSGSQRCVVVEALDSGPGIADLQRALAGGFSTAGGLGLGLSALKRIVDQFEIRSQLGEGTKVMVRIGLGSQI